jgi:hypothetical protein
MGANSYSCIVLCVAHVWRLKIDVACLYHFSAIYKLLIIILHVSVQSYGFFLSRSTLFIAIFIKTSAERS